MQAGKYKNVSGPPQKGTHMSMSLGEKIAMLRKERHWSQEELAARLDISRQSVSKWESDASVPDLDKVVRLGQIFDVSLDFLLKEQEEETTAEAGGMDSFAEGTAVGGESTYYYEKASCDDEKEPSHAVTLTEAEEYLNRTGRSAIPMATATALCVLSPVMLILLAGLSEYRILGLAEDAAAGVGLIILILMIGTAVAIFIMKGMALERYEYLEKESIVLDPGIRDAVEEKMRGSEEGHRICVAAGTVLCILSVLPLFAAMALRAPEVVYTCCVAALLVLVAAGVWIFVWSGIIWGSYQKLLQQGDYTVEKKRDNRRAQAFSGIYWCLVTAIYLADGFYRMSWNRNWIIWPCAGVLYAAVREIYLRMSAGRK